MADSRIHCIFYFIAPGRITPADDLFFRELSGTTVIVPIIAKADSLTPLERKSFLLTVQQWVSSLEEQTGYQEPIIFDFNEDSSRIGSLRRPELSTRPTKRAAIVRATAKEKRSSPVVSEVEDNGTECPEDLVCDIDSTVSSQVFSQSSIDTTDTENYLYEAEAQNTSEASSPSYVKVKAVKAPAQSSDTDEQCPVISYTQPQPQLMQESLHARSVFDEIEYSHAYVGHIEDRFDDDRPSGDIPATGDITQLQLDSISPPPALIDQPVMMTKKVNYASKRPVCRSDSLLHTLAHYDTAPKLPSLVPLTPHVVDDGCTSGLREAAQKNRAGRNLRVRDSKRAMRWEGLINQRGGGGVDIRGIGAAFPVTPSPEDARRVGTKELFTVPNVFAVICDAYHDGTFNA